MAEVTKKRKVCPAHRDPIRIVPLHLPETMRAPAASTAHLTYRNGPLIENVEVFNVYWGSGWQQSPASGMIKQLNDFFTYLVTSPLVDQLSEYSINGYKIGHGTFKGSATVTSSDPGTSVSDAEVQHMLQQEIMANAGLPQPGPNVLYYIYVQPGTRVVQGGSASCQAFCGYHDNISGQIFYAVMPYADCQGCTGGAATFDAMTSTSSHEFCEAITDPIPGQGWYDDTNGEIGDICAWQTRKLGAYTVQLEWSNKANKCI
jgi:hypothetical protein